MQDSDSWLNIWKSRFHTENKKYNIVIIIEYLLKLWNNFDKYTLSLNAKVLLWNTKYNHLEYPEKENITCKPLFWQLSETSWNAQHVLATKNEAAHLQNQEEWSLWDSWFSNYIFCRGKWSPLDKRNALSSECFLVPDNVSHLTAPRKSESCQVIPRSTAFIFTWL